VALKVDVRPQHFRFFTLQNNSIEKALPPTYTIKQINDCHGMVFLYQIADEDTEPVLTFYINIMDLRSRNKYHDHPTPISFTRYLQSGAYMTYEELHLNIYTMIRPYLLLYGESTAGKEEPKMVALMNIINSNIGVKQQLQELIRMQEKSFIKMPYSVMSSDRVIAYGPSTFTIVNRLNKLQIIDVSVVMSNWVKVEYMKLNRCVESEHNIQEPSQKNGYDINTCFELFCKEEVLG
jgi:hypothetical protein